LRKGGTDMSDSKLKEVKDKVVGGAKEAVGKVTDNEKLEIEGKLQKGAGEARGVANDVVDKAKDATGDLVKDSKKENKQY
jgi:uncharacterized protein YjbJ (UPF0337 family)